ncbi:MAG TPA: M55 family metallopeptidase [Solirubrobacteraceae bacterium]|nr:M55 family metallopeptidase [Solirubrobacteraceae bacterium]
MQIALSADMEGISQLRDPHSILAFERSYWDQGRRQLTADVVAAAAGLLNAGADEVIVLDNHGSGNPENVIADELPVGARLEAWNVFELTSHGVDAMLQVGYHARAGVPAYISHTYVPRLMLRVDGELISESHGRIWAAGVPLLGIIGNDAHQRTLGSLGEVPYLVVQRTSSAFEMEPVFADQAAASEAIAAFSAQALRNRGVTLRAPEAPVFESSFDAETTEPSMTGAGWQQLSETEYAIQLRDWAEAREPLATAMAAAISPWMPYFASYDLSSAVALERVHDQTILIEGRERFAAWLHRDHPEWQAPEIAAAP